MGARLDKGIQAPAVRKPQIEEDRVNASFREAFETCREPAGEGKGKRRAGRVLQILTHQAPIIRIILNEQDVQYGSFFPRLFQDHDLPPQCRALAYCDGTGNSVEAIGAFAVATRSRPS